VNFIFVFEKELLKGADPCRAEIQGPRAKQLLEQHQLVPGVKAAVAVENLKLGKGLVIEADANRVLLELDLTTEPPAGMELELAVAVPRPQTVKKLLNLAASSGVTGLHFIRTQGVVKSYLQSKSLLPDAIQTELLKGVEQAGDCHLPRVCLYKSLQHFAGSRLEKHSQPELRLMADVPGEGRQAAKPLWQVVENSAAVPVLLAIGPESGWHDEERVRMLEFGFVTVSLGQRMQRVETAAAMLLGQIGLMQEFRHCSRFA
jgi:16S rRNA (uracil1498-N3)-methyltransferase